MRNFHGRYRTARTLTVRLVDDAYEQSLAHGDEDYELEVDVPTDVGLLWSMIAVTDRLIASATTIRTVLRNRIADRIGEGGAVRLGGSLVRYSSTVDRKPTDRLAAFLKTRSADEILAILPTSNFRVSALRKIAEGHGYDPDLLEGTFYVETFRPATVSAMPVDHPNAPKYAAEMVDGEIRPGRRFANIVDVKEVDDAEN